MRFPVSPDDVTGSALAHHGDRVERPAADPVGPGAGPEADAIRLDRLWESRESRNRSFSVSVDIV